MELFLLTECVFFSCILQVKAVSRVRTVHLLQDFSPKTRDLGTARGIPMVPNAVDRSETSFFSFLFVLFILLFYLFFFFQNFIGDIWTWTVREFGLPFYCEFISFSCISSRC